MHVSVIPSVSARRTKRAWLALPAIALGVPIAACSSAPAADAASDAATGGDGQTGDIASAPCSWSGTWSVDATTPLSDCATPAIPMLHIDDDGGVAAVVDGSSTACVTTSTDRASCHLGAVCDPWWFTFGFYGCPSTRACSGVVSTLGGACGYAIVLNRVGP
jgi:hypothetical protein